MACKTEMSIINTDKGNHQTNLMNHLGIQAKFYLPEAYGVWFSLNVAMDLQMQ